MQSYNSFEDESHNSQNCQKDHGIHTKHNKSCYMEQTNHLTPNCVTTKMPKVTQIFLERDLARENPTLKTATQLGRIMVGAFFQ
jgi:hypothetical protein